MVMIRRYHTFSLIPPMSDTLLSVDNCPVAGLIVDRISLSVVPLSLIDIASPLLLPPSLSSATTPAPLTLLNCWISTSAQRVSMPNRESSAGVDGTASYTVSQVLGVL